MNNADNPCIYQSWTWIEAYRQSAGVEVIKLLASIEGHNIGCLAFFLWREMGIPRIMYSGSSGAGGGPILVNHPLKSQVFSRLLAAADTIARKKGVITTLLYSSQPYQMETKVPNGYSSGIKYTPMLHLEEEKETLWNNMAGRAKTACRKAIKQGIVVTQAGKEMLQAYHVLQQEVARRRHLRVNALSALYSIWEPLKNEDMISLFIAMYQERVVAGAVVLYDQDCCYYHSGGSTQEGMQLQANNLLQWHIIEWANRRGLKTYNMVGGTPDKNDTLYGITRFKLSFGGHLEEFRRYSKTQRPILNKIENLLIRLSLRQKWLVHPLFP